MSDRVIAFRTNADEANLLRKVCKARGEDLSSFARRAIRKELALLSYLSEDEKKALGIRVVVSTEARE